MLARLRISSPAATSTPPIQLASTGLPSCLASGLSCSAMCVGSVMACGRQNHQHAVGVRIVGGDFERLGVALGGGVADDIDRVVVAPGRRQHGVVGLHGFGRQLGQFAAAHDQGIGGQHAGTAGIGDDGQPRPLRAGLLGQHFGHVEQVGDVVDAQHAAAAEGGFQHFVAAGERAGVGCGGLGGGGRTARLDDDDRLVQRHFARRRKEGARVADRSPCRSRWNAVLGSLPRW